MDKQIYTEHGSAETVLLRRLSVAGCRSKSGRLEEYKIKTNDDDEVRKEKMKIMLMK